MDIVTARLNAINRLARLSGPAAEANPEGTFLPTARLLSQLRKKTTFRRAGLTCGIIFSSLASSSFRSLRASLFLAWQASLSQKPCSANFRSGNWPTLTTRANPERIAWGQRLVPSHRNTRSQPSAIESRFCQATSRKPLAPPNSLLRESPHSANHKPTRLTHELSALAVEFSGRAKIVPKSRRNHF